MLLGVAFLGTLAIEFTNLHVDFYPDRMVVRKGIRSLARPFVIQFKEVRRVRAYDFPNLRVTVDLDNGRRVKIANSMTEVEGELPEVEFETGKNTRDATI